MDKEKSSRILKSIDDYVKGRLNPEEVDKLWEQLLEYPEYYAFLKTEAGLKKHFRKKNQFGIRPAHYISRSKPNRIWILPFAALLVLGLFLYLYRSQQNEFTIRPYVTEISFLHLVSPDVTRSSTDHLTEFDQALHRSFQLSATGDMEEALPIYHDLLETSDDPQNLAVLNYNLGILYYNNGNYTASARHFEDADCPELNDFAFIESCYWLRTNSFLAVQNFENAYDSAIKTRDMNGSYKNKSLDLLQKLSSVP